TGVFVDERGIVRHLQAGDFSARDDNTLARVDRFLAGDPEVLAELSVQSGSRLKPLEQELVDAKVRLASELLARGQQEDALAALVEVPPTDEYDDEHLPGASNIPLKTLDPATTCRLDRERPVIVYCYDTQ